ncbi:MAG: DEAD/DEAH box helicase [Flavobacteriia bacterium]|nr:DEAD/DEAH box helicase [Flavobacteriia bacterium]OIP47012.1 MAG: DEAD/DEAH box helicase [Flavobacteriaceae bacterium CG2_30_31_66]PIV96574.1 MAG: DEAD/DEAH box helicase [Flavobacteriaceae bacterium CG17_big_fil_post_rev_8_21_14_2_50_31_13]PIX10995.1 MAG: DEAD/DEAH box helicase [Flavobacteriaceae bacterium CG_4_8_14_3_um_filter_31_8]PIY13859.1 MAG: DEAD/DEAH box helicase [Flavobacteriaceae bacterium CG_4_10_14_3_um_filter_31_253]PIZ10560.1 MAG: DEAD/DEAH box helicase [Flavobacteriaceae bacte
MNFADLDLSNQLQYAIDDLKFEKPTPIQYEAFPVIRSGKDVVGIAQTGTGKTFAYMLPILRDLSFLKTQHPRILVLVPTRELVLQAVEDIQKLAKYLNIRVLGVYGGVNINTQKQGIAQGQDIIVATPGRLYDLALSNVLKLKTIQKLVIDEVDVMLDLGFRFQLMNIFDLLPEKRQNILFSATMTEDVSLLIDDFFKNPEKISIAVSGTPLENITQIGYNVPNFFTKVNLLHHLLKDKTKYNKVLIFVAYKRTADLLFKHLEPFFGNESCVIHSNKTQNYRIRSIRQFDEGFNRILLATDVMARGLDFDNVSHVINFDTPDFPENYMHRIGRTGRAEKQGNSILLSTEKEQKFKEAIETLMDYKIPILQLPQEVAISEMLTEDERPKEEHEQSKNRTGIEYVPGEAFHEKSEKNSKVNLGGSYRREIAKKYKKPKTRGDKNYNKRNKK